MHDRGLVSEPLTNSTSDDICIHRIVLFVAADSQLTMRRVAGSTSELILVGVHNPASARANLQAALQVTGYTTVQAKCAAGQTSEECGKDVCRGRGNAELDKNGVVLCQCTSGWNTGASPAPPSCFLQQQQSMARRPPLAAAAAAGPRPDRELTTHRAFCLVSRCLLFCHSHPLRHTHVCGVP